MNRSVVSTVSCEICGAAMRRQKAWLYHCSRCRFLISTLTPAQGTGVAGLEQLRRHNFEVMLDRIEQIQPLRGTRMLEVGSAWGWFLEAAQRRHAKIRGIEPEGANAEVSKRRGFDVETGFFPESLKDRNLYHIIVFNDVFEHIPNPSAVLKEVEKLLNPSGMVVFNLPSSDGILFKIATMLDVFGAGSWLERM